MGQFCSYDYKRKHLHETNFTTFVIALCVVCQALPPPKKITKMVVCLNLHLKSYLENYFIKIIPVFC